MRNYTHYLFNNLRNSKYKKYDYMLECCNYIKCNQVRIFWPLDKLRVVLTIVLCMLWWEIFDKFWQILFTRKELLEESRVTWISEKCASRCFFFRVIWMYGVRKKLPWLWNSVTFDDVFQKSTILVEYFFFFFLYSVSWDPWRFLIPEEPRKWCKACREPAKI